MKRIQNPPWEIAHDTDSISNCVAGTKRYRYCSSEELCVTKIMCTTIVYRRQLLLLYVPPSYLHTYRVPTSCTSHSRQQAAAFSLKTTAFNLVRSTSISSTTRTI